LLGKGRYLSCNVQRQTGGLDVASITIEMAADNAAKLNVPVDPPGAALASDEIWINQETASPTAIQTYMLVVQAVR
jgi:hypothetical protein